MKGVMVADDAETRELMLNRFRRLLREISRGDTPRNSFELWEIDILLDMQNCAVTPRRRAEILKQYDKAVERQLEAGEGPPMRLSEFLVRRSLRRGGV